MESKYERYINYIVDDLVKNTKFDVFFEPNTGIGSDHVYFPFLNYGLEYEKGQYPTLWYEESKALEEYLISVYGCRESELKKVIPLYFDELFLNE
jgi:hypothetical protein